MVLLKVSEAGLVVNRGKYEFCRRCVRYLGYLADMEGLKADPEKVRAIIEYPTPKDLKGVRRLHGMGVWYIRFIPNFSELVEPCTR